MRFRRLVAAAVVCAGTLAWWSAGAGAFPRGMDPQHFGSWQSQSITGQTFAYADTYYVDPARLVPLRMIESAFRQMESSFAEVIVDVDEEKRSARVRVSDKEKSYDLGTLATLADAAAMIDDAVAFVQPDLEDREGGDKLLHFAINGALRALDPHSNIFSTRHFKEFKVTTSGSFGGIGFTFNAMDGEITIISPIPDTPASRAGLQSGDKILYIDGVPTTNMSSDTAVSLMRGEPGTKVTLTIGREAWTEARDFTVTREIIHVVSVESRVLQGEGEAPVAYVRIKNFQTGTSEEVRQALEKARDAKVAGVVLDLRNNPGGLLDEAVKVADGFLDSGTIVSTRSRTGKRSESAAGYADRPFTRLPLVVLINRGSASASEIVSAALQDSRAIVLGEKSFGKGSVQQAFPLTDGGGVLLTISQYLTPGDVSIQSIGIQPDVILEPVAVNKERLVLVPTHDGSGEADLENAFNEWGNARRDPLAKVRFLKAAAPPHGATPEERVKELSEQEKATRLAADFEIRLARRILARAAELKAGSKREPLLGAVRTETERAAREEDARIVAAMAELGVDWSPAPGEAATGAPKLSVTLPPEHTFRAGEKARITVTARNEGTAPVHRLRGRTECDNPLFRNLDFAFGRLAPGEERAWTAEIELPVGAEQRWDSLRVSLAAPGLDPAGSATSGVQALSRPSPTFAYAYTLADENAADKARSGDGRLEEGERATLALEVRNRGAAESPAVEVNLLSAERQTLYLQEARRRLEKLLPGADQTADLSFRVVKPMEEGKVKISLTFSDRKSGAFFTDTLEIPTTGPYQARGVRVPPSVTLAQPPAATSESDSVTFAVQVEDDESVKDLCVYRGEKKVAYLRNAGGGGSFSATLTVPLEKGSNRLVLVARDGKELSTQKVLYVNRTAPRSPVTGAVIEPR